MDWFKEIREDEIILSLPKQEQKILSGVIGDLRAVCSVNEVRVGELNVEFV
jgi:hypothetical protein